MRPHLSAALPLAAALAMSSPAAAGPVAVTAHAVENKVETHQGEQADPSPARPDPDTRGDETWRDDSGGGAVVVSDGEDAPFSLDGPGRLDLYAGGHDVVDSQGAFVGEVRASRAWLGVSASDTSYFEEVDGKRGRDRVRLDLMAFCLNARLVGGGATEIWIDGGLAASSSTEYDAIFGAAFGLRGETRVHPQLTVVAQARFFNLEADVSAFEAWAGVRAWVLQAGYRVLRFNVGDPLHGPEAGLALRF
jgi:hypothetical protein